MEQPQLIFLGYRAKQPWAPESAWWPDCLICCVGDSLCEPPEDWVTRWDFNRGYCYATPEAAWETVGEDREGYALFAYEWLPVFHPAEGEPHLVIESELFDDTFPSLPKERLPNDGCHLLGYDVAECELGFLGYPYSPTVSSGSIDEIPINRYGLYNSLEDACDACSIYNREIPEHGPHWVFGVYRN